MYLFLNIFVVIYAFCIPYIRSETIDGPYGYSDLPQVTNPHTTDLCFDLRPQHSVNIKKILGEWYANEIIKHEHDIPGVYHYDSCVIVNLFDATEQMQSTVHDDNNYDAYRRTATPTYQQQYQHRHQQQQPQQHQQQEQTHYQRQYPHLISKYIRLVWSEKDDNMEYIFNYTEANPGLWHNVGEQRGSLVALNHYQQFSGHVQVVKAVNDHLVLTFCDMESSTYSIILTRHVDDLSSEDIQSIRKMLSRRHLSTDSVRKVCSSNAIGLGSSVLPLLLLVIGRLRKLF